MHPKQLYMNNPDQTGPKGAVLSGFILFARYVTKVHKQMREQKFGKNDRKKVKKIM